MVTSFGLWNRCVWVPSVLDPCVSEYTRSAGTACHWPTTSLRARRTKTPSVARRPTWTCTPSSKFGKAFAGSDASLAIPVARCQAEDRNGLPDCEWARGGSNFLFWEALPVNGKAFPRCSGRERGPSAGIWRLRHRPLRRIRFSAVARLTGRLDPVHSGNRQPRPTLQRAYNRRPHRTDQGSGEGCGEHPSPNRSATICPLRMAAAFAGWDFRHNDLSLTLRLRTDIDERPATVIVKHDGKRVLIAEWRPAGSPADRIRPAAGKRCFADASGFRRLGNRHEVHRPAFTSALDARIS